MQWESAQATIALFLLGGVVGMLITWLAMHRKGPPISVMAAATADVSSNARVKR